MRTGNVSSKSSQNSESLENFKKIKKMISAHKLFTFQIILHAYFLEILNHLLQNFEEIFPRF